MKIKWLVLTMALVIAVSGPAPAAAEVITLDGIANAGSPNDPTRAHLYVYNLDTKTYEYMWNYSPEKPTPAWPSREALVLDLADHPDDPFKVISLPKWEVQSAGDVFNNPANAIWKSLDFAPGTYTLRLTSDSRAYKLNAYLWGNESSSTPIWNAYVQMLAVYDDGQNKSFNFGDWDNRGGSEAEVLDYYRSLVLDLVFARPGTMYFYINDYNAVDNAGSVTLDFSDPPQAPLPGSLLLLGTGLATLLAWRRRQLS